MHVEQLDRAADRAVAGRARRVPQPRELRFHRYAYLFVDGVNVSVRLGEDPKLCLLVVIGVREDGEKELLAIEDGYRESEDSWAAVFRDLRDRGMNAPKLVTGDGALGAWAALRNVFPGAREQRCWVHKTANVLDVLPKRLQPRAKNLLHEMAEAPTRADARKALERFRDEFDAKYPKAVAKLDKDWERSPRSTTSPPSTGGTSGRRTRSRAASRPSSSAPRSPRAPAPRKPRWRWPTSWDAAQERWRRFNGHELVTDVLAGVKFKDGIKVTDDDTTTTDEKVAA